MRTKKSSALSHALETAKEQAADLGDRLAPAVEEARERIAPLVGDARERIAPIVEDARDRIAPLAEEAATRAREGGLAARTRAQELGQEWGAAAATRLDQRLPDKATPAVVSDHAEKGRGGVLKKLLLALGLGAVVAVVVRKVTGGGSGPEWHTGAESARPAPAAAPAPAPSAAPSPAAATSATGEAPADDAAGGSPDEAVADSEESARVPTTPDAPAERIEIKE